MLKITVGWMYPNLLNLHGERGSIQALADVGRKMGIEVDVQRIEDFDTPVDFSAFDLLIFLPGEITTLQRLITPLTEQKLPEYIENGGFVLAIGTSGLMFGKSIVREDNTVINCLGCLDMTAKERQYVWGDDLHIRINRTKQEMVGSQIQMADVETATPLATVLYGMGNNNSGNEGATYKNLIYTNCLGPLFVKNPWFAESILKDILLTKAKLDTAVVNTIADNSFRSTLEFINTKK